MTESPKWPNFFIIGAAKAGTTSLYAWLKQHPQVFMSPVKEPHFFSHDLVKTPRFVVTSLHEYLRLFDRASGFKAIGEASASYFPFGRTVARRIKEKIPRAKIIVLLRDPLERAYADYLMYLRTGRESCATFYDALKFSPFSTVYIQTYAKPLREWLEVFGEKNTLVLLFEELKKNPRDLLIKVAEFLEIDLNPVERIKFSVENPGGVPRGKIGAMLLAFRTRVPFYSFPLPKPFKRIARRLLLSAKPPIDPMAIDYLCPVFERDLEELESLLGRKLPELRKVW